MSSIDDVRASFAMAGVQVEPYRPEVVWDIMLNEYVTLDEWMAVERARHARYARKVTFR
jgi:hypothetical protein